MEDFARLFETDAGQVCMIISENDDEKTELKIYFAADELSTSSISMTMKDNSDKSIESARKIMREATKESVTRLITGIVGQQ